MSAGATQATLGLDTFKDIAALAYRESGLLLVPEKLLMVQSRLRHRLRALQIHDFDQYASLVCSDPGRDELRFMISALTTNVSHFFREPHHFDLLTEHLLPIFRKKIATGQRIRIWSAGCSNGQEPYSIAMHLCRTEPALARADFRILATDIDPNVVAFATRGTYPEQQLTAVSEANKSGFFEQAPNNAGCLTVQDYLKKIISFRELNLLGAWPMRQTFDAIFCRNVVIYFDTKTQEKLWPRFKEALAQDGMFFLGHSERISSPDSFGFSTIGPTAYKADKQLSAIRHN
ncbi:CheR family methyltransferase [uncultured Tateyamaria sp.]|uniref:CheR family methyltransferase n=1 Tax=uncultured Tateyamaria sp. TaxID=455651 RepID=UPI00262CE41E|nr:CheR family methyltransferase [uncultured Tateyamaria sp.]